MSPLSLAAAAVLALLATGEPQKADPDPRDYGPDKLDTSSYPDEQKAQYPVFAHKCVKCHPLARTINSRFTTTEWKRYMKRMIRRPNSGINEEQAAAVYQFLKYYSSRLGLD
jgi:hypothetical protein